MGFGKQTPERASSGTKKTYCAVLTLALGHRPGSHKKSGTGHRDAETFTPFGQFRIKTAGWGWASAPTAWHGLRPSGFGTGGTTAQG